MSFNVLTTTVSELVTALEQKTITSEEVVTKYLQQIDTYNDYLRAVISTAPRSLLIEQARRLDDERVDGHVRGPLHGVPILVKDNIATHPDLGMETTAGTFALVGPRVRDNAPCVQKLVDAGAIIIAKANLSELSNYRGLHMPTGWSAVGGLTQSPYVIGGKRWDDGYAGHSAVGGSSSGSCAGVAAGFAPASLGTDTHASILMPATRNDCYAMKPTVGLISGEGVCPISPYMDSVGPIARSARDVAILMDVLVDARQKSVLAPEFYVNCLTGSWKGIRLGLLNPQKWYLPNHMSVRNEDVDKQRDAEISQVWDQLKTMGVIVKEVEVTIPDNLLEQIQRVMDLGFKDAINGYLASLETSQVRNLDDLIQFMHNNATREMPDESPNISRLERAASIGSSDLELGSALKDMISSGRSIMDKLFEQEEVNVLLGPADSKMSELYASSGYPMAALPLTYAKSNGRPMGLCAIAAQDEEGLLIQLMSVWEKDFQTRRQMPTCLNGEKEDNAGEKGQDHGV